MTGAALDADVSVDLGRFHLEARLSVLPGETVALMGPSGAGKSTLLGVLAGLVPRTAGRISIDGRIVDDERTHVPANRRGVVLLGQQPRLFPHLSARENIAFGPRARGADRHRARSDADAWLERLGLAALGDARPAQLSGGQQQRVAIARALATEPAAVLLDEPLTALDPETADGIRAVLLEQLARTGTTAILATHSAVDAIALAHRLVVLEGGRVTQAGAVRDVLAHPATRFVAAVAGVNRVEGRIRSGRFVAADLVTDAADPASRAVLAREGAPAVTVFRPSAVRLSDAAGDVHDGWLARVERLEQTPAGVRVRTAEPPVAVDLPADAAAERGLRPGLVVRLGIAASDVRVLPADAADSATRAPPTRPGEQAAAS